MDNCSVTINILKSVLCGIVLSSLVISLKRGLYPPNHPTKLLQEEAFTASEMSSSGCHFINNVSHLYFYMLHLTPPERIRALAFDKNGDICMDSPHFHDLSPSRDSEDEDEVNPADLLCPSPPENPDEIDPLDRDAPSPPDSGSENSWRDCTLMSPGSPYQELEGVPVHSPETSSSPPGLHFHVTSRLVDSTPGSLPPLQ